MKLLVATSWPPDGGSGISAFTRELTETLVTELGVEVHYMSPAPERNDWFRELGIRHVRCGQHDEPLRAVQEIIRYVREHHIDGAINNDNPFLQSIAPALPCPVIVVGHMVWSSLATLVGFNHEWIDHVVAISYDMQRIFVKRFGIPPLKCPVVYGGVRDRGHSGDFSRQTSGTLRVLFAGGYSRNKGGRLVEAGLAAAGPAWSDVKLDWFGSVPERVQRRLGGRGNVEFHGRQPREVFHDCLRRADVLLLPSYREACPMVMLEAMSFGVVPIASDGVGAMRWLVQSGSDGFICNLRAWPEQMRQCIDHLRSSPRVLEKLKRAARERFLRDFQSTFGAQRLLDLLARPTVDRSRPPDRITVLRWHRPLRPDGLKAPLIDRFCIRAGILRRAGELTLGG